MTDTMISQNIDLSSWDILYTGWNHTNTQACLLVANKENIQEENAERTKCMFVSRQQNPGKNHNIKVGDKSFKTEGQITVLGQP